MPTLVIFIALAILLAIVLAIIVLMPWLRVNKSAQNSQLIALNVEIFKERLDELGEDYRKGQINESEFNAQKTELERQLLLASDDKNQVIDERTLKDGYSSVEANITKDNVIKDNAITDQDSSQITEGETTALVKARRELQFTRSTKARLTILVCVPVLIILGYFLSGDRSPVVNFWQTQDEVSQVADDLLTGKIDAPPEWATKDTVGLMGAIQANVHHHAHDAMRWMRLADIFLAFDANDQALEALSRAYRLEPANEEIAVGYAQTKFFTSGGFLDSSSYQALQTVLQSNPNHQGAQMLMAMGEARSGNYDQAQAWVNKLREGISAREGDHTAALKSLDELSKNIAEQKEASMSANNQPTNDGQNSVKEVAVTVSLNSSLIPLLTPGDTLFVTIQQAAGGAPLAVKRMSATQLASAPNGITVTLSDSDAMMPTHTLSKAVNDGAALIIKARVSKSGDAIAAAGDLMSNELALDYQDTVSNDNNNSDTLKVAIEINQQVP